MPRLQHVLHVLGGLIFVLGACMLTAVAIAVYYEFGAEIEPQDIHGALWPIVVATIVTVGVGLALFKATRIERELNIREGFAVVGLGWAILALFGALPYWIWGGYEFASFTNCYFESISGLTTTGASILEDIERLPHSILWWRSFTHWLGGMGIIVLTLALLPLLGYGVMQLFKAEVPGPTADKLTPRVRQTAKLLWIVYVAMSLLESILLWGFGHGPMDLFDAACHTFGTLATGGFSTRNASIGAFGSAYVDWVVIAFMLLAGANFTLHFHLFRHGRIRSYWKSEEFRIYILVILGSAALISFYVAGSAPVSQGGGDLALSIRLALFQVASIVTTTGYATADYELWPTFAQVVIFVLMFAGGCAGSTGGGVKIVRHMLLTRSLFAELKRLLHPRAIIPVRMDAKPVPRAVLGNVHSFALLYMMLIGFGAALLSMRGVDLLTSFSVALSCLSNVGPAFGSAGPAENYSSFDAMSKWVLSLLMLTGRLELYTVAVLLTPSFWKH